MTETMLAAQAYGSDPSSLVLETVPRPTPGPGDVLVEVMATALTRDELTWPEVSPFIPCHDLSGVVAEVGDGVVGIAVGDEVYGLVPFDRPGAAATYVVAPSTALAPKPSSADHLAAASVPLAALTAWQALVDHADLQPGQHVVVLGGAGGVGQYVVQVAAHLGATVTATASADAADVVAALGARTVVDFQAPFDDVLPADVVVDTIGGEALDRAWALLRPGGLFVGIAAEPSADEAEARGLRAAYFVVAPDGTQLTAITALVESGALRTSVGQVFPLAEIEQAFGARDHGHVVGKVVLDVRPPD
jgi:NADPH:quinone reductase-like Zn-dependent oxidoreductase